jgi:hypothetical protein
MRALKRVLLAVSLIVMGTMSCSSIPYRSARNLSICPDGTAPTIYMSKETLCVANGASQMVPGVARVALARQNFSTDDLEVPDVFVGLAISGGAVEQPPSGWR